MEKCLKHNMRHFSIDVVFFCGGFSVYNMMVSYIKMIKPKHKAPVTVIYCSLVSRRRRTAERTEAAATVE